jgi:hypothetical protein
MEHHLNYSSLFKSRQNLAKDNKNLQCIIMLEMLSSAVSEMRFEGSTSADLRTSPTRLTGILLDSDINKEQNKIPSNKNARGRDSCFF